MLIDTHCHLTYKGLHERLDQVVRKASDAGVDRMITVAENVADARVCLDILRTHANVFLVAGIHPHRAAECTSDEFAELAALIRGDDDSRDVARRIVAVGETGLDFHYDFSPRDRQEEAFRAQLDLAAELDRPVVIHARSSEANVCDILEACPRLRDRVVFHCWSGDEALTERALGLGCYFSFTGIVTFRKADDIRASALRVPGDRIMVETDSPYLSPEPMRKIRPNEPALVVHTARFLADLRNEDHEQFAARTTANAERFFRLKEDEL